MKIIIDGREYHAETAVGLIDQIKDMHWQAGADATAEEYIAVQEKTYKMMTGHEMRLPSGDAETRAKAMFKAVAQTGAWIFDGGDR